MNSNGIFKAVEVEARVEEVKNFEKDKKARLTYAVVEESALAAIARANGAHGLLKAPELVDMLK